MSLSILKFLQHSNIFEKPTILLWIYTNGFSILYLTPAWAARFTTMSNLLSLNTDIRKLLLQISFSKNVNLSNDFTKHIIEIKSQYNDRILLGTDIYCLPIYMAVKDEFKIDTSFSDGALIFTLRYTLDNSVIMSYGSGYNVR